MDELRPPNRGSPSDVALKLGPPLLLGVAPLIFLRTGGEFENNPKFGVLQWGIALLALLWVARRGHGDSATWRRTPLDVMGTIGDDIAMGAPTYDARDTFGVLMVDAGLVAQTASKLQHGIIEVSQIGADPLSDPSAVKGVLYTGAAEGDQLGIDVAGLEDVTGDGFEDVALGAPFRDPIVERATVADAGTVYQVDGRVPADLHLGTIEVSDVGDSVAGTQLVGTDGFGPLPDNDPANDGTDTDSDGQCDAGDPDDDGDGVADGLDCEPLNLQLWATPGEVEHLVMEHQQGTGVTLMSWTAPSQPGTSLPLLYDTIRSINPFDFVAGAECLDTDGADTTSTDTELPPSGGVAYSLIRAENGCGSGSTGEASVGQPRVAIRCP